MELVPVTYDKEEYIETVSETSITINNFNKFIWLHEISLYIKGIWK